MMFVCMCKAYLLQCVAGFEKSAQSRHLTPSKLQMHRLTYQLPTHQFFILDKNAVK